VPQSSRFSSLQFPKDLKKKPGVVAHFCNLGTQEAEARGSRVSDQSGLHSKTLSQKKKTNKDKRNFLKILFPFFSFA
jgi:hypothetical protein